MPQRPAETDEAYSSHLVRTFVSYSLLGMAGGGALLGVRSYLNRPTDDTRDRVTTVVSSPASASASAPIPSPVFLSKKTAPPKVPYTDRNITITEVQGDYCKESDTKLAVEQTIAVAKLTQQGLDKKQFIPGYLDHGGQGKMGFYTGKIFVIKETGEQLYGLGIGRPDEKTARLFHEGPWGYNIKGTGKEPFAGWVSVNMCVATIEGQNDTVQKAIRSALSRLISTKVGIEKECK
jgi:hypothetical protein